MTVGSKRKRNDLQGIRGLAILSVLGFHFYPNLFQNGYLGVDQFFVLSGFLMCMLLTRSQKLPIFQIFSEFYIRRFKRILPLYFLFILCTMFALYTVFPDTAIFQNQASAGKALLFVSNRAHTGDEDYFEKVCVAKWLVAKCRGCEVSQLRNLRELRNVAVAECRSCELSRSRFGACAQNRSSKRP
ncbi:hypothetical protein CRE_21499 [Caenorhabditis remanei]|uniref:Acyltransferase 3 domain-containing protein n=1 Tax=Caenorhabditis remanei TaxID=31234 RepID=E3N8W6_CAERE|nr:hypothetical protein CRE_21499 [Caenorhabditis remanei]